MTVRPIKDLSVAGTVSYTGEVNTERFANESYEEDDGSRKLPAVCLLDIAINYNLNKNTMLWFKALNAANAKYQSSFSYPAARRSLYAGVTLKLWK
jgi:outer membrane cobalamin receptor